MGHRVRPLVWHARRATAGVLAGVLVVEMALKRIDLKWHLGGGAQAVFVTC